MIVLSASVPPEVKNISEGATCSKSATCFLAISTAERTIRPKLWIEEGLPKYQAGPGSKVLIRPGDIEQFLINKETKVPNINEMVKEVIQELHGSTAHTRPKGQDVNERYVRY